MNVPAPETKPWYRQFWPWLLISIPAATAIAGIATIWIASSEPVALVRDDYYKEGMAVNRNLAKDRRAAELGLASRLQFDAEGQGIRATLEGQHDETALTLALIHPLEIDRDQSVTLQQQGDGSYRGPLTVTPDRWYLQLEGGDAAAWRLKGEVDLRQTTSALLQPDPG